MEYNKKILYNKLMNAYLCARKNERNNRTQLEYELNLEKNLYDLATTIIKREYNPGKLICFIINYPVKREIFAPEFKDRVVSHLIYNELYELFERTLIYDSYSCRLGKGTTFGIDRAEHFAKSCTDNYKKEGYVLSLDISGYFMSINRNKLKEIVFKSLDKYQYRKDSNGTCFNDKIDFDLMKYLIEKILDRNPLNNCIKIGNPKEWEGLPKNKSMFNSKEGTGLIIGDLTSQLFSNLYMNVFDHYVKRVLKCKYYGRYVDDSFIMDNNKKRLKEIIPLIEKFLEKELFIKLNKKKTKITKIKEDFYFLGICLKPYRRYVRNRTLKAFKKKLYQIKKTIYNKNFLITFEDAEYWLSSINSYLGILKNTKSHKIKKDLFRKNKIFKKYFIFIDDNRKVKLIINKKEKYTKYVSEYWRKEKISGNEIIWNTNLLSD